MGTRNPYIAILVCCITWTTNIHALPDPLYNRCLNALRVVWKGSPVKGKLFHPVPISETVPSILVRDTDNKFLAIPSFSKINGVTLRVLFSHQFDVEQPNQFGAKGLVYKGLDGEWKVLMWSTGQGITGNNLHHRDALASVLDYEASLLELLAVEKDSMNSLKLALDLKERAGRIRELRRHDSIADNLLTRFYGFEMRVINNPRTGTLSLDSIDMESSLASASSSRKLEIDGNELNDAMRAIQNSIAPELYPRVYSISQGARLNIKNRIQLSSPPGTHVLIVPYEAK